jgi:prolyl-tRNA synthetase
MRTTTLPTQAADFSAWYAATLRRADLAEHGAVRGTAVIRPYGFAIWELVQRALDDRIKATGHENVYFPLLVPVSVIEREGELVDGFAPELAVVTQAGGKALAEPLAVRPTSEAVVWSTYARWIQSYRDLPLRYNQWANVVRWELRPRIFLRSTEFLWQEGHTAHATADEAVAEALHAVHDIYGDTFERVLALPALRGRKSAAERFPAALETYTLEAMMRDGKALQVATSHYLGQNFARAYGVRFTDASGDEQLAWATSWGASTRLMGALVMAHGDDRGLRLPPAVAPHQVVIVPVAAGDDGRPAEAAAAVAAELRDAGIRVRVDDRNGTRAGAKWHEWEAKGVPVRIDVGARELDAGALPVTRRDRLSREAVARDGVAAHVAALLDEIQRVLHDEAAARSEATTLRGAVRYGQLADHLAAAAGFAVAAWCGDPVCEARVKEDTSATIRCLPLEREDPGEPCIVCGRPGTEIATFAQSY